MVRATRAAEEASRVTVTVIAKNEEDRLPAVLASVRSFAEEVIVVVDASSTDATEAVAREAGATVLVRAFDGFGPQKNAAVALATTPWVLSIDADEVVTEELALEIRARLLELAIDPPRGGAPVAFRIPIRLEFLGKTLRFGRDTVVRPVRLFRRGTARFSLDPVHERVVADGRLDTLDETILHRSYRDLSHFIEKLDLYTTLAADAKRVAGKGSQPLLPLRVAWDLLDRAVLRLGFLDGAAGLTYAVLSAGSTLLKYEKLAELARKESPEHFPPAASVPAPRHS